MKTAHAFKLPYLQQLVQEINSFLEFMTVSFLNMNTYKRNKYKLLCFTSNYEKVSQLRTNFGHFHVLSL